MILRSDERCNHHASNYHEMPCQCFIHYIAEKEKKNAKRKEV